MKLLERKSFKQSVLDSRKSNPQDAPMVLLCAHRPGGFNPSYGTPPTDLHLHFRKSLHPPTRACRYDGQVEELGSLLDQSRTAATAVGDLAECDNLITLAQLANASGASGCQIVANGRHLSYVVALVREEMAESLVETIWDEFYVKRKQDPLQHLPRDQIIFATTPGGGASIISLDATNHILRYPGGAAGLLGSRKQRSKGSEGSKKGGPGPA